MGKAFRLLALKPNWYTMFSGRKSSFATSCEKSKFMKIVIYSCPSDNFIATFGNGRQPAGRCGRVAEMPGSFLPEGVGAVGSYEVLPADRQEVPGRGYQGREYGDSRRRF